MDADVAWNAVTTAETELVAVEAVLQATIEQRQAVEAGGLGGLWARFTAGSAEVLDAEIEKSMGELATCEAALEQAEAAFLEVLRASDPTQAEREAGLRAIRWAMQQVDFLARHPGNGTPDELLCVRRTLDRVQRWCPTLDQVNELADALARIRQGLGDTDPSKYLATPRFFADRTHRRRADETLRVRQQIPLLAAKGNLLAMERQLREQSD